MVKQKSQKPSYSAQEQSKEEGLQDRAQGSQEDKALKLIHCSPGSDKSDDFQPADQIS